MRLALAVFVFAVAGSLNAQSPTSIRSAGGFTSRFIPFEILSRMMERPEGAADSVSFAAPMDSAWAGLKRVLDKLEVPIGFEDVASRQMGHAGAKIYRRLGKQPLSMYLRCGEGIAGPNADTYMVYFTHISVLGPAGIDRVALYSLVGGQAVDVAGGRNDPVSCTSTGRLEQEIAKQLGTQLFLKDLK
jgi:hypothetical protein